VKEPVKVLLLFPGTGLAAVLVLDKVLAPARGKAQVPGMVLEQGPGSETVQEMVPDRALVSGRALVLEADLEKAPGLVPAWGRVLVPVRGSGKARVLDTDPAQVSVWGKGPVQEMVAWALVQGLVSGWELVQVLGSGSVLEPV